MRDTHVSGGTRGTKAMRGDGVVGGCFVSGRTVLCVWTIDCPQQKALKEKKKLYMVFLL